MRHGKKRHQLNRFTSWHKATLKSLARNIITYQSIKTTIARAKAVKPLVEKLISLAKENTLNAKRRAFDILGDHKLVSLLFKDVGPLFAKRNSGFTRIINVAKRRGDNAKIVIFELTEKKVKEVKKSKSAKAGKTEPKAEDSKVEAEVVDVQDKKVEDFISVKDKHKTDKQPAKKFLGGIRSIFKKKGDSL